MRREKARRKHVEVQKPLLGWVLLFILALSFVAVAERRSSTGAATGPPLVARQSKDEDSRSSNSLASKIEHRLDREFQNEDAHSSSPPSPLPASSDGNHASPIATTERVEHLHPRAQQLKREKHPHTRSKHEQQEKASAQQSQIPSSSRISSTHSIEQSKMHQKHFSDVHAYYANGGLRSRMLTRLAKYATELSHVLLASDTEDVEKLVDHASNEFVLSKPAHEGSLMLQQDLQLISDLIVLLVLAAALGTIGALCGQPTLTGYIAAGSLAGPGGLQLVQELVQVETIGQFGVVFLLFTLGMEFDTGRLSRVRNAAVFGGVLQVVLLMLLGGLAAVATGAHGGEGVFVGVFLSMSSTASVIKCLSDKESASLAGQIAIGTLVMQDCIIGLLFAILPLLESNEGDGTVLNILSTALRVLAALCLFAGSAWALSRARVVTQLLETAHSKSAELFQVALIAVCLVFAFASELLGLSLELGAFVAGVVVTTSTATHDRHHGTLDAANCDSAPGDVHKYGHSNGDQYNEKSSTDANSPHSAKRRQHPVMVTSAKAMAHVEPIRNVFAALFLSSIGIVMNMRFLYDHCIVVVGCASIAIAVKATLCALVLRALGYGDRVSIKAGVYLAHVGEISFLLLSRASAMGLISSHLYLLLLGTISLSLIVTPLLVQRGAAAILSVASFFRLVTASPAPASETFYTIGESDKHHGNGDPKPEQVL